MNNNDVSFLQHRAHGGDHVAQRFTSSAIGRLVRRAIEVGLAAVSDRFPEWGESTQLGQDPEQVIGRKTGART
jgi:hypothetical protein